jgi:hypothetical protein
MDQKEHLQDISVDIVDSRIKRMLIFVTDVESQFLELTASLSD